MVDVQSLFYIVIIGFALYFIGRQYKDYTSGVLGGFLIFLTGLAIWINPVSGLSVMLNTVIGSILFGWGGYVWVRGSIELINEYM